MAYSQTELFVENNHGDMTLLNKELCIGDVYFVDSTSANAGDSIHHGKSRDHPFATLAYAVTQTTDAQGDWIVVGPNHTETVAAADGIEIVAAMTGLTIAGAAGRTQDYPTITFDTDVNADFEIDGAGTIIKRIHFVNTQDACVAPFDVNAAGCEFHSCIFEDAGADNTLSWITVAAAAHEFKCIDCINLGTDTAGNNQFIAFEGASAHCEIRNLQSNGDFAVANIDCAAALTDVIVRDCHLETANNAGVNFESFTGMTGFFADNNCIADQDADVIWVNTNDTMGVFESYGVNDTAGATGESGRIIGARSA